MPLHRAFVVWRAVARWQRQQEQQRALALTLRRLMLLRRGGLPAGSPEKVFWRWFDVSHVLIWYLKVFMVHAVRLQRKHSVLLDDNECEHVSLDILSIGDAGRPSMHP